MSLGQKLDELAKLATEVSIMVRYFLEEKTSDEPGQLKLEVADFYRMLGAVALNASFFQRRIGSSVVQ